LVVLVEEGFFPFGDDVGVVFFGVVFFAGAFSLFLAGAFSAFFSFATGFFPFGDDAR